MAELRRSGVRLLSANPLHARSTHRATEFGDNYLTLICDVLDDRQRIDRADILDGIDPIKREHHHVQNHAPSSLSGMRKTDAIECKSRCVAYRNDDPMHWPEVWDLFNGELQPPRAAHYELGVARSEP